MIFYSLFVFFLIASAFIANKILVSSLPPLLFVGLRMGISGILLLIMCGKGFERMKTLKKYFFQLHLIAFFTTFVPSLLRAFALRSITSSRAAFWGTFEPFIAAMYMYVLFGKRLSLRQMIGCVIGVGAGIFFVVMSRNTVVNLNTMWYMSLPDLAQIASLVISRYGWIRAQHLLQYENFAPRQLNGLCFTISGLAAFAISLISGEYHQASPTFSLSFVSAAAYTLTIGNMVAYTLYAGLLQKRSVTFVSLAGLSMPLFVHLISPLILPESWSWAFFVSLAMIFIALQLFYSDEKKIVALDASGEGKSVACVDEKK